MSLRNRLALVLIATIFIAHVLMSIMGIWYVRSVFIEAGTKDLGIAASVFEEQFRKRSEEITDRASVLLEDHVLHELMRDRESTAVREILTAYQRNLTAEYMTWIDPEGTIVMSTKHSAMEGKKLHSLAFVNDARQRGETATIFGYEGRAYWGVLFAVYSLSDLVGFVGAVFPFDNELVHGLLQDSSIPKTLSLITRSLDGEWTLAASSEEVTFDPESVIKASENALGPVLTEVERNEHLSVVIPLESPEGTIPVFAVLDFPLTAFLSQDPSVQWKFLIPVLIALAIGLVGVVIVARSVSRPVEALAKTALRIQAGDYSPPPVHKSRSEVARLSQAIAHMVATINDRQTALETAIASAEFARDEAIRANQAKSSFLANMSHELRTPLNAVIGFSEIIREEIAGPIGNPAYMDYARNILVSGKQLLALVEEMLDLARVESGKYTVSVEPMQAAEVLAEVIEMLKLRAERAGVAINAVEGGMAWPEILGDRTKIKQAFTNLLKNAIVYTPSGGNVSISWRKEGENLTVTFADTGIGIAESDIPLVLRPFHRVHSANDGRYQGVGLGFPLVKAIMDLHGGKIDIKSKLGKGTTVSVTLPLAQQQISTENAESGFRDDQPASAVFARRHKASISSRVASSGERPLAANDFSI